MVVIDHLARPIPYITGLKIIVTHIRSRGHYLKPESISQQRQTLSVLVNRKENINKNPAALMESRHRGSQNRFLLNLHVSNISNVYTGPRIM
ncbi:hypothetical protein CDAR_426571 [Caerostris darwini]|uniref:Uncharacterized protein n=1 Tax=Caerostris darwini TaxID=1538125 RepID=A0AAV4N6H2_9ARAC|nr:hypothetical protein CDAR_426571 [Caerostris darwini]